MKCICGYEHEAYYDRTQGKMVTTIGYQKFIKINVNATYEIGCNNLNEATIYACPKCGTLKMDIE